MDNEARSAASQSSAGDPRVYLAAERTFLAWIRTGLALMGFGFVLARFGVFLQQIQLLHGGPVPRQFGGSIWVGVSLVAIGVVVNLSATANHIRLFNGLRQGRADFDRPSKLGIAIAITLAVVGLAAAIYLIFVSMRITAPK
jgi:putative membrane protein